MSNRRKLPVGVQDQMGAAEADAWSKVRSRYTGRLRENASTEDMPQALQKVSGLLFEQMGRWRAGEPGSVCPHKDPRRAEPTHWFAAVPNVRMCEKCAPPFVDDWSGGVNQCDLCHEMFPHDVLTMINGAYGHFIVHAALCDGCYPEGVDAPRLS